MMKFPCCHLKHQIFFQKCWSHVQDVLFQVLKTIQEECTIQNGKLASAHLASAGDKLTSFIRASEIENSDGFRLSSPSYSKYRSTTTKNEHIGKRIEGSICHDLAWTCFLLRGRRYVTPNHYHCLGMIASVQRSSKAIAQCTCNWGRPDPARKASLVWILIRSLSVDGRDHLVFIVQYPINTRALRSFPNHPRG